MDQTYASGTSASEPAKTSGMAIASLVLGILGACLCLPGIVGLILGIVSLSRINDSGGRLGGRGLAVAGIAVSASGMVLSIVFIFMGGLLLPALAQARMTAKRTIDMASLRELAAACSLYASEHDGAVPPPGDWVNALSQYGDYSKQLTSSVEVGPQRAWAMNAALSGLSFDEIARPELTVLLFEAVPGSPLAGGPELLPDPPRHRRVHLIACADGSVQTIQPELIGTLIWQPVTNDGGP